MLETNQNNKKWLPLDGII